MRAREFIREAKITIKDLYRGEYPERRDVFWDYIRPSEFDIPLEIKTMSTGALKRMMMSHYGVDHPDEMVDMLRDDEDRIAIVDRYKADPALSNKVILVANGQIIDGNHRALAAVLTGRPIRYVDLAEFDEVEPEDEDESLTENLKSAIGNSGKFSSHDSSIVNEGEGDYDTTKVYYHGTTAKTNFKSFKIGKGGIDELGPGIYVTSEPFYADYWAGHGDVEGGRVIPVYLKRGDLAFIDEFKRMAKTSDKSAGRFWLKFAQRVKSTQKQTALVTNFALLSSWFETDDKTLANYLKINAQRGNLNMWLSIAGYIGGYGDGQIPGQVVVFDPSYLKSAIGNRGKYDPANTDLLV